jgi:hypothetical protein
MKKLLTALGVAALLAGCASHENNGMGGTSDDTMKTDSMKTDSVNTTGNSGSQYNNNATQGTGSSTAPNDATSTPGNTPGTSQ